MEIRPAQIRHLPADLDRNGVDGELTINITAQIEHACQPFFQPFR